MKKEIYTCNIDPELDRKLEEIAQFIGPESGSARLMPDWIPEGEEDQWEFDEEENTWVRTIDRIKRTRKA